MAYSAERAYELIAAAHGRGRLAHALLISGAPGAGKERLAARIIQLVNQPPAPPVFDLFGAPVLVETAEKALDDLESDHVHVVRPVMKSRRISVEEIRDLEHPLHLGSAAGTCKVGVIVDADRMSDNAANAFLKTLEEPPANTLLLLLTANPQRLLPTILSRCLRLPLTGGQPLMANGGAELVAALNQTAQRGFGTPVAALQLKMVFSGFLDRARDAADEAAKAALKEETAAYRETTDGTWLRTRENFHNAAASAEYLDARNRFLDVLMAWMADLLRLKAGFDGLDFPAAAPVMKQIIANESHRSLLRRIQALDDLRRTLETNALEALALEVAFLKAFA